MRLGSASPRTHPDYLPTCESTCLLGIWFEHPCRFRVKPRCVCLCFRNLGLSKSDKKLNGRTDAQTDIHRYKQNNPTPGVGISYYPSSGPGELAHHSALTGTTTPRTPPLTSHIYRHLLPHHSIPFCHFYSTFGHSIKIHQNPSAFSIIKESQKVGQTDIRIYKQNDPTPAVGIS